MRRDLRSARKHYKISTCLFIRSHLLYSSKCSYIQPNTNSYAPRSIAPTCQWRRSCRSNGHCRVSWSCAPKQTMLSPLTTKSASFRILTSSSRYIDLINRPGLAAITGIWYRDAPTERYCLAPSWVGYVKCDPHTLVGVPWNGSAA